MALWKSPKEKTNTEVMSVLESFMATPALPCCALRVRLRAQDELLGLCLGPLDLKPASNPAAARSLYYFQVARELQI